MQKCFERKGFAIAKAGISCHYKRGGTILAGNAAVVRFLKAVLDETGNYSIKKPFV